MSSVNMKIPKKALRPAYYKALYDNAMTRQNEPHMEYWIPTLKRAHKLALSGKDIEAEDLLKTARSVVRNKEKARQEELQAIEDSASREHEAQRVEAQKIASDQRRKIMRRLYIQTHGQPVRQRPAKTNRRYNLRNNKRQRKTPERLARTFDEYLMEYISQIKHKKQLLVQFLLKMYNAGLIYRERSKKFAKPKN